MYSISLEPCMLMFWNFYVLIPHEKLGDLYFFLSQSSPILELFPFDKITLKSYICTVVTVMAKQCWSQTVLESGSWGHSVLQTPALVILKFKHSHMPDTQLDVNPTCDQEIAGSTPAGSATFFRVNWSWNIFYGHSLPSADSRRTVVSFWRKNVHSTG